MLLTSTLLVLLLLSSNFRNKPQSDVKLIFKIRKATLLQEMKRFSLTKGQALGSPCSAGSSR